MTISEPTEDNNLEEEISSPLSEEQWQSLIEQVPTLEELRTRSLDKDIPPTGVLFTILAEIGLYLPIGTTMQSICGKPPIPPTAYSILIGEPSAGKSATESWTTPDIRFDHISVIANTASGQGITNELLQSKPEPADEDEDEDLMVDQPLTKPHGRIVFDEGVNFDYVANNQQQSSKFMGTMNSAFMAYVTGLNQAAAGKETRRIIPPSTKLSMSAVVRTQPGYCHKILERESGFGARWLLCFVDPKETNQLLDGEVTEDQSLLDGWRPHDYGGQIPFADDVHRLVTVLSRYAKNPFAEYEGKNLTIINSIDECFIEMVKAGHHIGHTVLKFMKIASSLAVYERSPSVEMRHLYAAELLLGYSNSVSKDYGRWYEVYKKTRLRADGSDQGIKAAAAYESKLSDLAAKENYAWSAAEAANRDHPDGFTPSDLRRALPSRERGRWSKACLLYTSPSPRDS